LCNFTALCSHIIFLYALRVIHQHHFSYVLIILLPRVTQENKFSHFPQRRHPTLHRTTTHTHTSQSNRLLICAYVFPLSNLYLTRCKRAGCAPPSFILDSPIANYRCRVLFGSQKRVSNLSTALAFYSAPSNAP
jgi:hypothetical protein